MFIFHLPYLSRHPIYLIDRILCTYNFILIHWFYHPWFFFSKFLTVFIILHMTLYQEFYHSGHIFLDRLFFLKDLVEMNHPTLNPDLWQYSTLRHLPPCFGCNSLLLRPETKWCFLTATPHCWPSHPNHLYTWPGFLHLVLVQLTCKFWVKVYFTIIPSYI